MTVEPDDLTGLALPALRILRLVGCGPSAHDAADALVRECPALLRAGVSVHDGPDPRKWYLFPQEDLDGLDFDGVRDVLARGFAIR